LTPETGQRGYIITAWNLPGAYDGAREHARQNVNELRELTIDNPVQRRALDLLEPLVAVESSELQDRVELRKRNGFEAAAQSVRDGSQKQSMDHIRNADRPE